LSPQAGSFVGPRIDVSADLNALSGLAKVKVHLNGVLVQEFNATGQLNQRFSWSFIPANLKPQNLLQIEAIDRSGRSGKAEVIVFK
jgi:hypothetical protein